jgi:hypothetical protein
MQKGIVVLFFLLPLACYSQNGSLFFVLFTNNGSPNGTRLSENTTLTSIPGFLSESKVYLIIHGFLASTQSSWVPEMASALLQNDPNSQVLAFDWSNISDVSNVLEYEKVVDEMNQTVRQLQSMLENYIEKGYFKISNCTLDVHCIGSVCFCMINFFKIYTLFVLKYRLKLL